MNGLTFEEVWAEHKRFILTVGGGLFVVLLGLSWVSSIEASTRRQVRLNRQKEGAIESLVADLEGREGFASGLEQVIARAVAPRLRGTVEHAPRPEFALAEGATESIAHFQALEVVRARKVTAQKQGMRFPASLGLDPSPPVERIREQLALIDVCDRLIDSATKLGVEGFDTFQPQSITYEELLHTPKARGGRRGRGGDDEPEAPAGAGPALVLRRLPVRIAVTAKLDTIHALLASFQRTGAVLEVSSLELKKGKEDRVQLAAEVAALSLVDPEAAPKARLGSSRGGATRGASSRRSRRSRR